MYRGFNIKDITFVDEQKKECIEEMSKEYDEKNNPFYERIEEQIEHFFWDDDTVNAVMLQDQWFPQLSADIFISHSHKDESLAKAFAIWLDDNFRLNAFIDSTAWNYYEYLIERLSEQLKVPNAAIHAHLMLNQALLRMIDHCECLFFLNTPNSINLKTAFSSSTYSPWSYSEIGISKIIEKKRPQRYSKQVCFSKIIDEAKMGYELDLSHLTELSADDLNEWSNSFKKKQKIHSLDCQLFIAFTLKRADGPIIL